MTISRFILLNTGFKMPSLGFGTYLLKGDALKDALDYALFLGYRHIDTAAAYGNEPEIGQVIEDRQRAGKLNRKDVFITSKVSMFCMERQSTLECVQQSLDSLKTTYMDMLLVHHPWACRRSRQDAVAFQDVDLLETWSTLVSIFNQGQASSIGVSNFTQHQLQRILSGSSVVPANVQLECHVYYQQHKLKSFCDCHNIAVSAYAPLGAPNRPSHHVQSTASPLADPVIVAIAQSYKKTPAQILLNFLLRQGFVVLPKSGTKVRIKNNFDSSKFTMTNQDLSAILALNKGQRFFNFLNMKGHPEYFHGEDF